MKNIVYKDASLFNKNFEYETRYSFRIKRYGYDYMIPVFNLRKNGNSIVDSDGKCRSCLNVRRFSDSPDEYYLIATVEEYKDFRHHFFEEDWPKVFYDFENYLELISRGKKNKYKINDPIFNQLDITGYESEELNK